MTFGEAILAMRNGQRVTRPGWNGKKMWLGLVLDWGDVAPAWDADEVDGLANVHLAPFIAMKTADDKLVPWLASQTDMLAEDWEIAP